MSKINLAVPLLENNFVDLRDSIPGDPYNWSWVRPLSQVKYLAIHHSAGPDTQTPEEIANYHINNNSWGGIGYHFLIAKDGVVYYVGDISTARANVANLNDIVLGICLIGNFTSGSEPTSVQLDSAHKLCGFFINNYPDLTNIDSWDKVKGHKELSDQSTTCPGDDWQKWKLKLIAKEEEMIASTVLDKNDQITEKYKKDAASLKSQVENLQTSLASVNQQVIILQETLQEREEEIKQLKKDLADRFQAVDSPPDKLPDISTYQQDNTLTIIGALVNLYKFIFQPRKEAAA